MALFVVYTMYDIQRVKPLQHYSLE